jgi:hypothetical protein
VHDRSNATDQTNAAIVHISSTSKMAMFRARAANAQGGGGSPPSYGTLAWAAEHAPLALSYADGLLSSGKAKNAYGAFTDPPAEVLSKKAPTEESWLLPEGFEQSY